MKSWCYILKCKDGSYYVGSARDLNRRLSQHVAGQVHSTKTKLPVSLIHSVECDTYSEAYRKEKQIKSWKSRKAIERFIKNTAPSSIG